MKNKAVIKLALCVQIAICAACAPYEVDEILVQAEDVSLVIRGTLRFEYNPDTCQMAYNAHKTEFRAMKDNMADYFVLKCSEDPTTEGQELKADLTYTTVSDVKAETGLTFKVEKISPSDGRLWLWCQSKKIGVVIRKF